MKKERIMVDGIKYRYIINDFNEIELNKEVSKEVFNKIKNILIKKGKYFDQIYDWPEIPYEEIKLKERFKNYIINLIKSTIRDTYYPIGKTYITIGSDPGHTHNIATIDVWIWKRTK